MPFRDPPATTVGVMMPMMRKLGVVAAVAMTMMLAAFTARGGSFRLSC
jgi:hypothetical protein